MLIEPKQDLPFQAGKVFTVDYWDGCCIHITGPGGLGATLNRDRFTPYSVRGM